MALRELIVASPTKKPVTVYKNLIDSFNDNMPDDQPINNDKPDEDNIIPMLDEDWFPDDITERFRKFLRVTFGDEHFQENLS